jgi:hypothetical protein
MWKLLLYENVLKLVYAHTICILYSFIHCWLDRRIISFIVSVVRRIRRGESEDILYELVVFCLPLKSTEKSLLARRAFIDIVADKRDNSSLHGAPECDTTDLH